jgi:hypothetical protein
MKLKIMTSDAIAYVKENIDLLADHYKNGEDPEKWIRGKIGKTAFIELDKDEYKDFNLIVTKDKPSANDVENIKLMYEGLKNLNDSFATDERLWAGLSHTLFYEYLLKRWPDKFEPNDILNHFFFMGSKPRCYMINTLARLWWVGRKTYIENSDSPWKILEYIGHDLNGYSFTLFGSNWSNSERSMNLFFDAIFKFEKETDNIVDRSLFNDAMQHMNGLCGIYAMDACDDNFIVDKIYTYLLERTEYLKELKKQNKEENVKTTGIEKLDKIVKAINNLGGIASVKDLVVSLSREYGGILSDNQKEYLVNSIKTYCPDLSEYNGRPLFHIIYVNGEKKIKISTEYLYNSNISKMNAFTEEQINNRNDDENIVFQIITTIKNPKFSINDIMVYKTQLNSLHPEIDDIDKFIVKNLESLKTKGILEKQEKNVYKKAYAIKS